jgi:hypothetical protein
MGWKPIRKLLAPLVVPFLLKGAYRASSLSFVHSFESERLVVHGYLNLLPVMAMKPERERLGEDKQLRT